MMQTERREMTEIERAFAAGFTSGMALMDVAHYPPILCKALLAQLEEELNPVNLEEATQGGWLGHDCKENNCPVDVARRIADRWAAYEFLRKQGGNP